MQFSAKDDFLFIGKTSIPGRTVRTRDLYAHGASADGDGVQFPGSEQLCWHCCHACTPGTLALPMPIEHDERTDVFTVVGAFCSFSCMKAFNSNRVSFRKDVNYLNISLFARRFYGRCSRVTAAHQRNRLRVFGGDMTIEDFRQSTRDPPYPTTPFSLHGEPSVVVVEDDSHNIKVVPHDSDPVIDRETRLDRPPPPERAVAPKKPVAKWKKKEPAEAPPSADDAMLKLRRTGEDGAAQQGGGSKCILESMLCFTEG